MPQFARSGRARISLRRPEAMGECDRTGFWYPLSQMRRQFQWAGNKLIDTGLLVGPDQVDVPQDQFRSIILPPDPRPVPNPRPSQNTTGVPIIGQPLPTSPGNQGFTQFVINASIPPFYPMTKSGVLSAVAALSGVPTPSQVFDRSTVLTTSNTAAPVMGTQPARGWMVIYNPTNPQAQITLSNANGPPLPAANASATWGVITNLILGPGEAYVWATSQGLGACYEGALAAIGLFPGMAFWAWESGGDVLWLTDEFGNLITDDYGQAIPLV